MGKAVQRVLIYRLGSLGDTVVALPALHLVRRAFPDAERRLLTNFPVDSKVPAAAAILAGTGLVDGYFRYKAGTRRALDLLKLWWSLLRWRPQVLVYLAAARGVEAATRDARFFRLCGIRRQAGIPLTEALQKNLPRLGVSGLGESTLEPECERLLRNVAELGTADPHDPQSWDLALTSAEQARALEVLLPAGARPILAVSVGTKMQAKDWGRDNWRSLLERLGALYPGYALLLVGAPEEREASAFAAEGWRTAAGPGSPVINLCGHLTPRESAACLARARLFLGHDSGPMHLAAAVQTPCVAVFSARNIPRVWFPYGPHHRVLYRAVDCMGCRLETCIVERKKCMTSIEVEEVVAEVVAALETSPAPEPVC